MEIRLLSCSLSDIIDTIYVIVHYIGTFIYPIDTRVAPNMSSSSPAGARLAPAVDLNPQVNNTVYFIPPEYIIYIWNYQM